MREIALHVCLLAVVVGIPTRTSFSESIAAKLDELQNLGYAIDPEELLESLKQLSEGKFLCNGIHEHSDMQLYWLRNTSVTCNDGTHAGYYIRKADVHSSRWIVFLEGGWFCFDQASCRGRWLNMPHLMSSKHWPPSRKGSGILSWDQKENPFLFDANLVYVPYCSSDSWSGTRKAQYRDDYSFMGAYIVEEVIRDLLELHELGTATKLYLAGSSAGGTGVLINLDRVAGLMSLLAPQVKHVRGIADSGWFLDNKQYKSIECTDVHSCAPVDGVEKGIQLWGGLVPDNCKSIYSPHELWRCYFGYRVYPTLKTPIFVVQHLFDEAQIQADNVGPPVRKEQWQYIHDMGLDMKQTLMNVSAVFAPACLSHMLITRSEWYQVSVNGVTLPEALKCWESGQQERNLYEKPRRKGSYLGLAHQLITGESLRKRNNILSDAPDNEGSRRRHERRRKRGRKGRRKKDKKRERDRARKERQLGSHYRSGRSKRWSNAGPKTPVIGSRSSRTRRAASLFDLHDVHHMRYHGNQCNHHRIDHCAWPQCNFSCPKIHNPFTGEEMDFIDLLMQFGLDLSSIAEALGMDLPTLQSMDHKVLLRLLIGQSAR